MKKLILRYALLTLLGISVTYSQDQPNILFIFSDDHTYQSISAYNTWLKDVAVTPSLDQLASEGMIFNRAYVTNSLCGPSRAVIQTGKYSHKNGFHKNGDSFNGNQQTFPKLMRAGGYQTAVIGKWHLGTDPQGYDYWDVMNGQGQYYNPTMNLGDANGSSGSRTETGYNSTVVADLAMEWLTNDRDNSKPFMLMMQFKATHRGWAPGPGDYDMFDGVEFPEAPGLWDDYSYRGSPAFYQDMTIRYTMTQNDVMLNNPQGLGNLNAEQRAAWDAYYDGDKQEHADLGYTWSDKEDDDQFLWKYRQYLKSYLACAAGMDRAIGRVLQYLEDNNLAQNTVVIYSSDQGFYLGEHGWFDKRFMYEESFRTPMIVRWPGEVAPGSVNDQDIVSNLDLPETFLELAGLEIPSDMQGASMVPVLKGQTPADWRTSFYYHYYEGPGQTIWHDVYRHYGVTTGRYKLIYFHDVDEWEFYDLKKDPHEMINQYYIPENAALIDSLKTELERLRVELEVPADPNPEQLQTVEIQQWTDPLPLTGCNDPTYQEYDPEVTDADPAACVTLGVNQKFQRVGVDLQIELKNSGSQILFTASTQGSAITSVKIRRPNGHALELLQSSDAGKFIWNVAGVVPGVYIAEVLTLDKGRKLVKFFI